MQPFFSVIMPNYNNSHWLDKSIPSILNQTFKDFEFIFIDDVSTDDSVKKAQLLCEKTNINCTILNLNQKRWNGGCRNLGLQKANGKYIIFIDSDDWINTQTKFEELYNHIVQNNYPDLIRLAFNLLTTENEILYISLKNEINVQEIVNSCFVACWTKCIKKELIVPFPENTLMEDVVQSINQLDKIKTVSNFLVPFIVYNKQNTNSCSIDENNHLQNNKWKSSMYRYCADLLDLQVKNDYCEKRRKEYLQCALQNLKENKYIQ